MPDWGNFEWILSQAEVKCQSELFLTPVINLTIISAKIVTGVKIDNTDCKHQISNQTSIHLWWISSDYICTVWIKNSRHREIRLIKVRYIHCFLYWIYREKCWDFVKSSIHREIRDVEVRYMEVLLYEIIKKCRISIF